MVFAHGAQCYEADAHDEGYSIFAIEGAGIVGVHERPALCS